METLFRHLGIVIAALLVFNIAHAEEAALSNGWAKYIHDKQEAEAKEAKAEKHAEKKGEKTEAPASEKTVKVSKKKKKKLAHNSARADRSPAGERNPLVPNSNTSAVRPSQSDSPVNESPQEEETRLTKNWGGARTKLSDFGIDLALIYKAEVARNFSGGIDQHTDYLGNLDLRASLNFEKMMGWKGGSAFVYFLGNHGGQPSYHVGDVQSTHNIQTSVAAFKLYEAWIQQLAFEDKVSFLVGLHDLNSEFYVTDAAGLYLNSSFGVGAEIAQTGVNGPSIFPSTATALRIRAEPSKNFYIQTAVFDAQAGDPDNKAGSYFRVNGSDGQLLITEAAIFNDKENQHGSYGKYGLGMWNYTRTFDQLSGGEKATNHGVYFIGEQFVLPGVAVFFRYGSAAGDVNPLKSNLSAGITFNGLLGRPKDRFGVGFTTVEQSDEALAVANANGDPNTLSSESTFEFTYRYELIPGVAIQPDLQYVMHPGMDPNLGNALEGTMRVELNF